MNLIVGDDDGLIMMKEGGVMCIKCGKVLSAINSGRRHVRETHRPNQRAQCQICKRFYKNERQRNNHLNSAHGITPKQMKNVIKIPHDQQSIIYPDEDIIHPDLIEPEIEYLE